MRGLILLQCLSAIVYYATAPFGLTLWIWLTLAVNLIALAFLWKHCADVTAPAFRQARWGFTLSIFLLEVVISMTDSPVSLTELQGLTNDAEVLITGVLLGVLWHDLFKSRPPIPTV